MLFIQLSTKYKTVKIFGKAVSKTQIMNTKCLELFFTHILIPIVAPKIMTWKKYFICECSTKYPHLHRYKILFHIQCQKIIMISVTSLNNNKNILPHNIFNNANINLTKLTYLCYKDLNYLFILVKLLIRRISPSLFYLLYNQSCYVYRKVPIYDHFNIKFKWTV